MLRKILSINKDIEKYSDVLAKKAKEYGCSVAELRRDCFFARVLHGADAEQYVAFEMWKLSKRERKTFVTLRRSMEIEKIFNVKYDEAIGNKHLFNKTYGKFVKRKWLFAPDSTKEEIVDFLQSNSQCLVKPTKSSKGKGIEKIVCEEVLKGDLDVFIENLVKQECVLEEIIKQHKLLSEINPTSVNSLRIATVRDKNGEVKVVGASLKVGKFGAFVDNFHAGGIQYAIDVDRGIIISAGVDAYGSKYYFHPDSNIKMIGLQLPNWEEVVKTVKEAGTISKTLRYIGWDVAILEDSCELIEGNSGQGCNGMQQDGKGKLPFIMSCK